MDELVNILAVLAGIELVVLIVTIMYIALTYLRKP